MSGSYYYYGGDPGHPVQADEEDETDQLRQQRFVSLNAGAYTTYGQSPQPSMLPYEYMLQQPQQHMYESGTFRITTSVANPSTHAWESTTNAPSLALLANSYAGVGHPSRYAAPFAQHTEILSQQYPAAPTASFLTTPSAGPSHSSVNRTASIASSIGYNTDNSENASPSAAEMAKWGYCLPDGRWKCSNPDCTSESTFSRPCDLRKHYKRHSKTIFCRYQGCPQSSSGGFSSKKDRDRHEASHNPGVLCEWPDCGRKFSRVDNMRDHIKRVHLKHVTGS